ncbi:MAG: hypothetical protein AAB618_00910 [Patescibacteria group bacterium]
MQDEEEKTNTAGKKELFLQALETMRGMVSPAADKSGISRQTFYNWEKNDIDFRKKVRAIKKSIPQMMEDRLTALGYEGNVRAIIYYLEKNSKKYMKKEVKETVAHIHHHIDRKDTSKVYVKTFEDYLYDEAIHRRKLIDEGRLEELKKWETISFNEKIEMFKTLDLGYEPPLSKG